MPRRRAKSNRKSRSRKASLRAEDATAVSDVRIERGRAVVTGTLTNASTLGSLIVSAEFNARLAALADFYAYYRFVDIIIEAYPAGEDWAVGFTTDYTSATPATASEIMDLAASRWISKTQTVPQRLYIRSKLLLTNGARWFRTIAGSPDPEFEFQGLLWFRQTSSNAISVSLVVHFCCEFAMAVPASVTQSALIARVAQWKLEDEIEPEDGASSVVESKLVPPPEEGKNLPPSFESPSVARGSPGSPGPRPVLKCNRSQAKGVVTRQG